MEKPTQKKNPTTRASGTIKKVDSTKQGRQKSPVKPDAPGNRHLSALDSFDIKLNPGTAKQAIILSEIIGKPVSKRSKHR